MTQDPPERCPECGGLLLVGCEGDSRFCPLSRCGYVWVRLPNPPSFERWNTTQLRSKTYASEFGG